jgi:hypothetical protein
MGEIPEFPYGTLLYRAQNSVKQSQKAKAHALCHIAFELGCVLASRLKKVAVNIPVCSKYSNALETKDAMLLARRCAPQKVRTMRFSLRS